MRKIAPAHGYQCAWLGRDAALARSPALHPSAVLGALWSATEMTVDPVATLRRIPDFLRHRYGVEFRWSHPVHAIQYPKVLTPHGQWEAERIIVCNGSDFESIYPEYFAQSGLTRCKLQMLRTTAQPEGWKLGPALAAGLRSVLPVISHLRFARCAARAYCKRDAAYDRFGIHTMVSQTSSGALTLGDSHDYGLVPSPFRREEIDTLILDHLRSFLRVPDFSIAERWYGVYAKHPDKPYVRFQPEAGVAVVTGLGGAGMTLSFGVAAETFAALETRGEGK